MTSIPFWHRLGTRLGLLVIVLIVILAGATAILVSRAFNLVQQDIIAELLRQGMEPTSELPAIIRGTIINLVAVFLLTLIGAAVFSRTLLTDPITDLLHATRSVARGNVGVTLPVTSRSELGSLAQAFNQMSLNLKSRTDELIAANEALKQSEMLLEQRVKARTSELTALLELSNSIALTVEDMPLLEALFDDLKVITGYRSAGLFELTEAGTFKKIVLRGTLAPFTNTAMREVLTGRTVVTQIKSDIKQLIFPIYVRDHPVGIFLLEYPVTHIPPDETVRLVGAFANQAGVAIENMKLYTDVQEKAAFEERQHLARELHDSVSQALYSIVLGTHAAKKQLQSNPEAAKQALEYVQTLAEAGLAEMRALIFELRPEILEKEGLVAALAKQLEALEVRHHVQGELEAEREPTLPFSTKQTLFRVVQEALHNVVKHAKATRVKVQLLQQQAQLTLSVADNGVGFDTSHDYTGHIGLKSMRERVTSLGGRFQIASTSKDGTVLTAHIPLQGNL